MALPTFRTWAARRNAKKEEVQETQSDGVANANGTAASDSTLSPTTNGVDVKLATKTRRTAIITSSVFFFISVIFLILVRILSNLARNRNQN